MIDIQNLEIGYKIKRKINSVFEGLNAKFEAGALVGLIGDNGIGKSTLLKTLTGYLEPLNGTILIQTKNINSFSFQELATLISIVTTEKIGGFNLTVYDVVALGRTPYLSLFGKLTVNDETIIENSLTSLSIAHLKDKLMDELSDGQRQKVMIAKSLAQQTPIIILDEPTAFLDYTSKHKLFEDLKNLCIKEKKLIIVSSHDIDLMQKYITNSLHLKENNSFELV
jgi:iron complex transport system ATP-binding protein